MPNFPPNKKKSRIEEVSRAAQVSKSTVSKALNNCGGVDPDMKELILRTAKDMAFTPAQKRRKALQGGWTVGVVMPINPYYFWDGAIQGMKHTEKQKEDFHLIFSFFSGVSGISGQSSEKDVLYCLDYIEDLKVDLLVITPPAFPEVARRLRALAGKFPIVFFNETADAPSLFYAGTNFYQDGIRLARASQRILQDYPGLLLITGPSLPMVEERDGSFCDEARKLVPNLLNSGRVPVEKLDQHLFSAQLARILHDKYVGKFRTVYVSQGFMPQVCLALHKLQLDGQVAVVGYENPSQNEAYMRKGMIKAVVEQDIYNQGVCCMEAVYQWLAHGILPANNCIHVPSILHLPEYGNLKKEGDDTCPQP